ncbi:isochorismatase family protein [Rubrivivax sp. JA1026]|uniref:isochorismatase family protein n=1 Tax=Rubrivivax sp. JA1026 TaxID=2710888 RepID=UPI0013E99D57|nr:isochorismatase family protein [Rubrivivax sp. JA1026]
MHAGDIHLLIIDPQNDFCDLPADWCAVDPASGQRLTPALPVAGAHADMLRLAAFIDAHASRIVAITVTLDSHHRIDVAHPPFWRREDGESVAPFTPITAQDVRARRFAPRDAAALPRTLAYLDALDKRGRYTLMVWPEHCRIGTWGHLTHAAVQAACDRWEVRRQQPVRHVFKGDNPWTEHYSAFQAEVPDIDDPATALNESLIDELSKAKTLVIAGEAGSHCVRASVEDLLAHLPADASRRVILLADCMSPVPGFEAEQQSFLERAAAAGVSLETSTEC